MRTCIELGHALGNQHWPALVKGARVFVPLTVDHKVMASVMKTHRFEGIRYEFVARQRNRALPRAARIAPALWRGGRPVAYPRT